MGNTRGKLWRCRDGVIEGRFSAVHDGNIHGFLATLPPSFRDKPSAVLGASVLDEAAMADFSAQCRISWGLAPEFARSSAAHAGVVSSYVEPGRLGVDRWLALIALRELAENVCVVDCGTAITLDVLRADGLHMGGYILPGLSMMAAALQQETRRVRFDMAEAAVSLALGQSTAEAVRHGALAAVVALIEGRIADGQMSLVLTGGDAATVAAALTCSYVLEPELLLHGLQRYFADTGIN
jgi:type III pantothenate kinase